MEVQVTNVGMVRRDAVEDLVAGREQHPQGVLDVSTVITLEVKADLIALQGEILRIHREVNAVGQRPLTLAVGQHRLRHVLVRHAVGEPPPEVR
jgi:hypothetical protein